ncbi:MAG: amidohydrolase family protein [Acidobacteria bacterium]|nr:amidohydrolase family protein [Acidobacteriota bacterium]
MSCISRRLERFSLSRSALAVLVLLVIGATACQQQSVGQVEPDAATVLTGLRIIDGTGGAPVEQGTIVIQDGRIVAAGVLSDDQIPASATTVDLAGKTVMPGIIDAHGHVRAVDDQIPMREDLLKRLRVLADYGVTTVVSLGQLTNDETPEVATLRDEQESIADLDRARIYTSGPSIQGQKSPEEARASVAQRVSMNADRIKFHMGDGSPREMSADTYGAIIDEAHKRGLRTYSHIFSVQEANEVLDAGIDVIAHSIRDQDVGQALIDKMKARNVPYIPTLTRDLAVFIYEDTPAFLEDPFFLRGVSLYSEEIPTLTSPEYQQGIRESEDAQAIKPALEQANRNLKILSDAGITIAMGTDVGGGDGRWQGYFEHVELAMMVEAGMTPMQVLVAATGAAADVSELDHLGRIQPGKVADLLVLDANPLDDILNTREIHSVWIAGRRIGAEGTN